jgi:hypothetical protein
MLHVVDCLSFWIEEIKERSDQTKKPGQSLPAKRRIRVIRFEWVLYHKTLGKSMYWGRYVGADKVFSWLSFSTCPNRNGY